MRIEFREIEPGRYRPVKVRSWVDRLLRRHREPWPEPETASAYDDRMMVSWADVARAASLISSADADVVRWLELAEADWDAFEAATSEASRYLGDRVADQRRYPSIAAQAVLEHEGFLRGVDWKFGADEVLWQFSNACERVGFAGLTDGQAAWFSALDPVDERQVGLVFPDLAVPLDSFLRERDKRLLGVDEDGDSYLFAIVDPGVVTELDGTSIGHLSFYDVEMRLPR